MQHSYDLKDDEKIKKPKKKRKKKKRINPLIFKIFSFIFVIITVATFAYTIIQEIFSLYVLIPAIIIAVLVVSIVVLLLNSRLRDCLKIILSILTFITMILEIIFMIYGTSTLKFLSQMTDTGLRVETYGIYVINDTKYSDIQDLDGESVTYLYQENDTKTKDLLEKITDKEKVDFELDSQDSLESLINYIVDGSTKAIFMSTTYDDIANEEYPDEFSKLTCIYTYDVVDYVKTNKSSKDLTKDTFNVYISGIDTSGTVGSKARTDVNIIMSINPSTHQILMIHTPRDYYVPLATSGKNDKLTHSGVYGIEESIGTLENLYDIDIDYYVRINFTSFIKIVNALGGITVNVGKSFCEQDSKRNFDNQICLKKGTQQLNGEQALAYARHRHTLPKGDLSRGENQMQILEAIANKAMSPSIIKNYNSLISALSGNVLTNMTTDEMYSFAKMQLKKNSDWTFSSISATGTTATKPCYALGNARASVVVPDESSVTAIKNALNNIYTDKTEIIVTEEETTTTSSSSR